MALGAVFAPAALVAIPVGLTFDLAGATSPSWFTVTVAPLSSTAAPPFAITVGNGAIVVVGALFGRPVGVVVAMSPFLPSPADPLLLGRASAAPASTVMVVTVPLAAVAAVTPPPLLAVVVPAAAAVVGVVPPSSPLSALPVSFAVAVVPPGRLAVVPTPLARRRPLLLATARLHHQGAIQVGLHVRVQVQGGGHTATLLGVQLVEQRLAAGPHVVPPQLIGPLLPDGHGLGGSLLLLTAHRRNRQTVMRPPDESTLICDSGRNTGWRRQEIDHP